MAHFQGVIQGNYEYGKLSGFAQTPRGGDYGTTSFHRPSFDEMDTSTNGFYSFGAGLKYNDYFTLFEYCHLHSQGENNLSQNLITHGQTIPQGRHFMMNIEYDWYRLSWGKDFSVNFDNRWVVTPSLRANLLKYHYHFDAMPNQSSRTFNLANIDLGLKLEYFLTTFISSYLQANYALPLSHLQIRSANIGVSYRFISQHLTLTPKIALGFLQLDYQDEQNVPNYIRYKLAPQGLIGLEILFP